MLPGNSAVDKHPIQGQRGGGGEGGRSKEILLDALCCGNWDKLQPDGPLDPLKTYFGLRVDLTLNCYAVLTPSSFFLSS